MAYLLDLLHFVVCVSVCVCIHVHVYTHVWRLEVNILSSFISPSYFFSFLFYLFSRQGLSLSLTCSARPSGEKAPGDPPVSHSPAAAAAGATGQHHHYHTQIFPWGLGLPTRSSCFHSPLLPGTASASFFFLSF